jgi:hypothetical protein
MTDLINAWNDGAWLPAVVVVAVVVWSLYWVGRPK